MTAVIRNYHLIFEAMMKNFYKKASCYTTLPNSFAQDNRLSIEARGMGLLIFSLPDDWIFRQVWFYQNAGPSKNRKKTVVPALNELIKYGYLARTQVRGQGRFSESVWFFDPEGNAVELLNTVVTTGDYGTVGTPSADPSSADPSSATIKEDRTKEELKKEKYTPLTPQGEPGGYKNRKKTLNLSEIADLHGFTISVIEDFIKFRLNSGGIDNPDAFRIYLLRELSFSTSSETNKLEEWFQAWDEERPAIEALIAEFLSIPAHWFDRRACRERGKDGFTSGLVQLQGYYAEIPGEEESIQTIVIEIAYQLAEQARRDRLGGAA